MRSLKKTVVLKVSPSRPDMEMIKRAARILRSGGLVAFPTETVYGLGADLSDEKAVARLCMVKKRPEGKPFTVHIDDISSIEKFGCEITAEAKVLMDKYWPGPLTIILNGPDGRRTGFRMPDNKVALMLIRESGVPVAAPSANISGRVPPTRPEDVLRDLDGMIDILLDAGAADIGVESTVIDMSVVPPKVLRQGAIRETELLKTLNELK